MTKRSCHSSLLVKCALPSVLSSSTQENLSSKSREETARKILSSWATPEHSFHHHRHSFIKTTVTMLSILVTIIITFIIIMRFTSSARNSLRHSVPVKTRQQQPLFRILRILFIKASIGRCIWHCVKTDVVLRKQYVIVTWLQRGLADRIGPLADSAPNVSWSIRLHCCGRENKWKTAKQRDLS